MFAGGFFCAMALKGSENQVDPASATQVSAGPAGLMPGPSALRVARLKMYHVMQESAAVDRFSACPGLFQRNPAERSTCLTCHCASAVLQYLCA